MFPHENPHKLSFDVIENNNTQHQNYSSMVSNLTQNGSSALTEFPVFERPCKKVEDYHQFKQSNHCYFQDATCTAYADELGESEESDNRYFGQYDNIISHDHYIKQQYIPHNDGDTIDTKENELLEQMNHFRCL